jgi:hypothetical protein
MTAFDLDDLTPRWSAPTRPLSDVIACAPLLCLTHSGGGMHGLDPADGAIRWVNEGWNMDRDLDRYLLVAPGPRDGLPSTLRLVVDPATGEPVAAGSESWSPLVSDGDGWLGQRYDPFRAETWVARIDPGTSTSRMLLHVRDVVNECWASTRALVCRRGDGGLGVWALPD